MPASADAYLTPEFIVNPVPQAGGSKEPKRAKTAETVLNILEGRIGVRRLAITTLTLVIKLPSGVAYCGVIWVFFRNGGKKFHRQISSRAIIRRILSMVA